MKTKKRERPATKVQVLDALVRSVCHEYSSDPSTPSVVVSVLPTGQYYASVVRYAEKWGQGKHVVCSARGETLDGVLNLLSAEWLRRSFSRENLRKLLNDHIDEYAGCDNPAYGRS